MNFSDARRNVSARLLEEFPGGALDYINHYTESPDACIISAGHLLGDSDVPTVEQVTCLLSDPLLRAHAVRVIIDGVTQPVEFIARRAEFNSKAVNDCLDPTVLRRSFMDGATIVVEDVARWHPVIAAISNSVFNDRWLYANAGYFLTRSGNEGLPFHADEEATFVFQIHGSKVWQVADFQTEHLGSTDVSEDSRVVEFVLNPGDAACIPPMYPHRTKAMGDEDSIHLTVGVRPFKLIDLLDDVAARGLSRLPGLGVELESIEATMASAINSLNAHSKRWRQELAVSSIRVASGAIGSGFDVRGMNDETGISAGNLGDLLWTVEVGERWLVYQSGTYALMDSTDVEAFRRVLALKHSTGRTWASLADACELSPAVMAFLEKAGWAF